MSNAPAVTGKSKDLIKFVKDRPGHDRRYSLDCSKLTQLGWQPKYAMEKALSETIDWYQQNRWWWEKIKNGQYLEYYKLQYGSDL